VSKGVLDEWAPALLARGKADRPDDHCSNCGAYLLEIAVSPQEGGKFCMDCYGRSDLAFKEVTVFWRFLKKDSDWITIKDSGKE
jgi:recombinational DNA repair protein (RecF pathway)